ncbi:MAG TPA: hypothetical protein VKR53_20490 [Puia sp.]|nr:hypothetical protein [Puia sp.]
MNNFNYILFRQAFIDRRVFSRTDVIKRFPNFDSRRLVEWQRKGYIQKITNKWYLFSEISLDEMLLYRIGNCLCRPSYISLESALSYYQMIPEGVYSNQSVTTHTTVIYNTPVGSFNYRSLKPALYFGYQVLHSHQLPVLMAEPEKALLDLLYLNTSLKTAEDIEALRLNYEGWERLVDWKKFDRYARVFDSATLQKRIINLKKSLEHANA